MMDRQITRARWEVARQLCHLVSNWLKPNSEVVLPRQDAWEPLIEAASSQLATPALSYALQNRSGVPQRVADYLDGVLFLNRERSESILGGLATTLEAIHAAGIEPVLLKGGASIASGLYPDPAIRIIGDIDLLLADSQAEHVARMLAARGFKSRPSKKVSYSQHHHLAPQYDPRTGLVVELHVRPLLNQWHKFLDVKSMIGQSHRATFGKSGVLIPNPTDRITHNIVHNQLSDGNYARHRLDVRQMLELAALIRRYNDEIDWPTLRHIFAANGQLATLQDTLEITEVLFGVRANASIGSSGRNPVGALQSEFQRSDLEWVFDRFVKAAKSRPRTLLRVFQPYSWMRVFKALRHDMRSERW